MNSRLYENKIGLFFYKTVATRKLSELGYRRSAKKCKEKFENVYKYHKRTKDGRTTKPDGKTYRFFEQLEALDTHPPTLSLSSPMRPQAPLAVTTMTATMLGSSHSTVPIQVTVSSTPNPITTHVFQNNAAPTTNPINFSSHPSQPTVTISHSNPSQTVAGMPSYNPTISLSYSTSSSTSSDEGPERQRKRKRKWKEFFGRLMTEVIHKQDELQKKFLDTLEKRERDRMAREEAWRVQEMAKMNREHELLVQERSVAAAKDAAVISFLQKITEQQNPLNPIILPQLPQQIKFQQNPLPTVPPPPPVAQQQKQQEVAPVPVPTPTAQPAPVLAQSTAPAPLVKSTMDMIPISNNGGGDNFLSPSPSRWPKAEVHALIKLRTTLDTKYHESGPKGPLWEEISASMRKLGYNRNAKRCKEKWENINKYYKKVKESNKKRPEDAKTCPYFHQLEALYKEKAKTDGNAFNTGFGIKPDNNPMVPLMVQPEQQWPLPHDHQQQQQQQQQQEDSAMEDHESENIDQNNDDYEDGDDEDEEDDDDGAAYEVVTNKQQPSSVSQERE